MLNCMWSRLYSDNFYYPTIDFSYDLTNSFSHSSLLALIMPSILVFMTFFIL